MWVIQATVAKFNYFIRTTEDDGWVLEGLTHNASKFKFKDQAEAVMKKIECPWDLVVVSMKRTKAKVVLSHSV